MISTGNLAGIPGSPAAFYYFLMDAVGDKLCDHQKVSKNFACRRQVFRLMHQSMLGQGGKGGGIRQT